MKFAAILGAALMLGAGAASAAEIGVRYTTGHTSRHITHGQFTAVGGTVGAYRETSFGINGGGVSGSNGGAGGGSGYVRHEVGAFAEGYKETYNFTGDSSTSFSEVSTFSN